MPVNEYGQMIGQSMEGYTPGALPSIDFLEGRYARIAVSYTHLTLPTICSV